MTESLTWEDILLLKNEPIPETRTGITAKGVFDFAEEVCRNCDRAATEEIPDIALPEVDADDLVDALRIIDDSRSRDPSEPDGFPPTERISTWATMPPVQRLADADEIAALVVADDGPNCHVDKFRGNWGLAEQTAATLMRIDHETMVSLDLDARIALQMDEQRDNVERNEITIRCKELTKTIEDGNALRNVSASGISHVAIDVDLADIPRGIASGHRTIRPKHG